MEAALKNIPTIDGHHHIWRLKDLTWLSGPQVPRIFGPYEAICRDYPIEEFRADTAGCNVVKSVYVQTNWPIGNSYDEAKWVQSVSDAQVGRTPMWLMRTWQILASAC